MADIDQQAELAKAGAHISSRWDKMWFYARRYPLGAVGAVIMVIFVFSAVFADVIAPHDPLQTKASASLIWRS